MTSQKPLRATISWSWRPGTVDRLSQGVRIAPGGSQVANSGSGNDYQDPILGLEGGKGVTITNKEYQYRRNLLISHAENHADRKCGRHCRERGYKTRDSWVRAWNTAFITEMDRLWAKTVEAIAGLGGEV
jgi:hypothetical protein